MTAGNGLATVARSGVALAESAGLADLARRMQAVEDGTTPLPRVVCAGPEKAGKSTLVNALVGRPLLSPVGDDVVTATYLVLTPAERDGAVAVVVDRADGRVRRVPVELAELADYVSVDAVHDNVVGAEAYLDSPLLREVELLDTPGAGGCRAGHSALTMASLDGAHTLLFVMAAAAPIAEPELAFLAEASRRTDGVVLAMTKVDLYPEWRTIHDDNRALIARHVPALADVPILPVASRLAEQAARFTDRPDAARRLLGTSGLDDLVTEIRVRAQGRAAASAESGRQATLATLLTELRARLAERPEYLAADPGGVDALRAEHDRLAGFLHDPHHGALEVNRRIQRVRRDVDREFGLQASALLQRYSGIVESASGGDLRDLPVLLKGELARLVSRTVESVDHDVADMLDDVESRVGSVAVTRGIRELLGGAVATDITDHRQSRDWSQELLEAGEASISATGTLAAAGLFAVSVATGGAAFIALGVATVATVGLRQLMDTQTRSRRQSLQLWLDRVGREVEHSFDLACGRRLDGLERLVNVELPRLLEARVARIGRLTSAAATAAPTAHGPAPRDVDALLASLAAPQGSGR